MQSLRDYEAFETVSELNEYIHNVLTQFDLKKTERELVWLLSGHSVKIKGVCWLKVQTMADMLGKSYKTIQRSLKRLKELGIIERVEQFRPARGGHSSFLTVFRPTALTEREEALEPAPESTQDDSDSIETFSFKSIKSLNNKYVKEPVLDYSFLRNSHIPEEFIHAVKPFFDSAKEIYQLWGKVIATSRRYAPDVIDIAHITDIAIDAFKQTVFAHKMSKIRKTFKGYFWGTLSGIFSAEQRRRVAPKGILDWNWLEDY
ncbi:helix-turn-helix domain-containing protein [Lysinibacillus sphaericus]|nr:helix-turn-helix domain-containing protein [Lysinibacillus sphaericus]